MFVCTNNLTSIDVCENLTTILILSTAVVCFTGTEKKYIVYSVIIKGSLQNGQLRVQSS